MTGLPHRWACVHKLSCGDPRPWGQLNRQPTLQKIEAWKEEKKPKPMGVLDTSVEILCSWRTVHSTAPRC